MLSSATWSWASLAARLCSACFSSVMSVITVTVPPADVATAENAVPPTVWRLVLEALARGIAQALNPLGHESVDVTLAVVAVLGQEAQEIRIRTPGLKQLAWHRVHLFEAVVADDDFQVSSV